MRNTYFYKMLEIGQKAPNFNAKDQDGNIHQLKDYKGKRLALYFYPRDSTPTCTVQACNLRDNYQQLAKKGIEILGVSTDNAISHQKFIKKHELPFPLLDDSDQKIVNAYEVWALKKFMGREFMGTLRTTFLINEKGKIAHIIDKPKTKTHAEEILEIWSK